MKFNWGTGIIIFFAFFATSMVYAVVKTTHYPPQMVQKDYYNLDINYQERLDKKQNAANLATPPQVQYNATQKSIQVKFPEGMTAQSGSAKCYRSNTTNDDFSTALDNTTSLDIPAEKLETGRWHVELDWSTADGKKYFWETVLTL